MCTMREKDQLFELQYENLLQYPEAVIRDIYSFLEDEYIESQLRLIIDSINNRNYFKWKTKMK